MSKAKEKLHEKLLAKLNGSFKPEVVKEILDKYGKPIAFKTIYIEKANVDDEKRSFPATASTENPDRIGDILHSDGWELKDFMKNPVLLWCHKYADLPIGKCLDPRIENRVLKFTPSFAPAEVYPFADTVFKMYKAGYLNAFSVGFDPIEWTFNEDSGGVEYYKSSLLEISSVPVPMNAEALADKTVQEYLVKSFGVKICSKCSVQPPAPTPEPAKEKDKISDGSMIINPSEIKSLTEYIKERLDESEKQNKEIRDVMTKIFNFMNQPTVVDLSDKIKEMNSILHKQG